MTRYIFIIAVLLVFSCASIKGAGDGNEPHGYSGEQGHYTVYKIDSINSYFLIYARKNDSLFKIVSKKYPDQCRNIFVKRKYDFELESQLSSRKLGDATFNKTSIAHIDCFYFDDSTKICLERDSITDFFKAKNVSGLCFQAQ